MKIIEHIDMIRTNSDDMVVLAECNLLQTGVEKLLKQLNELEEYLGEEDWTSVNGEIAIKLVKNKLKELKEGK